MVWQKKLCLGKKESQWHSEIFPFVFLTLILSTDPSSQSTIISINSPSINKQTKITTFILQLVTIIFSFTPPPVFSGRSLYRPSSSVMNSSPNCPHHFYRLSIHFSVSGSAKRIFSPSHCSLPPDLHMCDYIIINPAAPPHAYEYTI